MTPDAAKALIKEHGIKFILAQFVDIHGAAKAKAVPAEHLEMILSDGAGFAGFALWGFGMWPHGPDYMAVGELATLQPLPWMPPIKSWNVPARRKRTRAAINSDALKVSVSETAAPRLTTTCCGRMSRWSGRWGCT